MADEIPVLGICRGLQLLNVWAGGTLHQHVPEHARYDVPPGDRVDEVTIEPGTRLHELYGPTTRSTRCTTRRSTGSPTAGSSPPAAPTARSRRWSGRATTSSPCSGTPSCCRRAPHDPLFAWLVERARPGARAVEGLTRAPRPVVHRRRRPAARRAGRAGPPRRGRHRRRARLRLDGRRRQRVPRRQRRPHPPRAHRARPRRPVVHGVHRDVGAVGVGRDWSPATSPSRPASPRGR